MSTSNRWLAGIAGALVVLVAVSLIAALATRNRPPREYAENTPEGTTQRYLRALATEDPATAYVYLAKEVQAVCSKEEWLRQASFSKSQLQDAQVLLTDVIQRANGDTAVTVEITHIEFNRPFPVTPEEYSFEQTFVLKQETEGVWRLAEATWPVYGCSPLERPFPAAAGL